MFNKLKDEQARQAIINDLDRCIMVEAGAGSGKTRSLVQRMVALIKEGRCQVDIWQPSPLPARQLQN